MITTKWKLLDKIESELYELIPQSGKDCDVDVSEAHFDRFTKEYDEFHSKEAEEIFVFSEEELNNMIAILISRYGFDDQIKNAQNFAINILKELEGNNE